ncbi:unnamed protein product [Heligmosomoides polygyrus]|uniref:Transcriptional regulator n=1 Tax=Heligmosomoides polygyrus TaxID=6339 RepID=A0A183FCQ3_HELPZ|nr:unnamed protein product [Heligmosomoides polygyrus]
MAAGVREMVRPARLAYLQRIVRNLSTFQVLSSATASCEHPELCDQISFQEINVSRRVAQLQSLGVLERSKCFS